MNAGTVGADVIVVGAGPVGLWLAAELRLGGAAVTVVEKRSVRSVHSRALTVHARTLEILASRGVVDPWLQEGVEISTTHFAMLASRLDLSSLETDYPFALFLPQVRTEELLERHAVSVGADVRRGLEVVGVSSDDDGVLVRAAGPDGDVVFSGRYVVGCDGGHSVVRTASGINYSGTEDSITCVIGDVLLGATDVPAAMTTHTEGGSFYGVRIDDRRYRLIGIDHSRMHVPRETPVSFDEFRDTIQRLTGTDFAMADPTWLSRVGSATYQADRYRAGRQILAGDAAHVHFPLGGQGLNLGMADAMNLGWKLAAVVRGLAGPVLLDSYEAERLPAGRAVIEDTLAQTAIVAAQGREGSALRGLVSAALTDNSVLNSQLAVATSGIGAAYGRSSSAHPLVGRRVPNLELRDGSRVFERLCSGRFCTVGVPNHHLADRVSPDHLEIAPALAGRGDLAWSGIRAALIRPDGYLAWATDTDGWDVTDQLFDALDTWLPGVAVSTV